MASPSLVWLVLLSPDLDFSYIAVKTFPGVATVSKAGHARLKFWLNWPEIWALGGPVGTAQLKKKKN